MPILHGFIPAPAPALTAHLRVHLVAALREELKRDVAEFRTLPRERGRRDGTRYWRLSDRIARNRAELGEMGDL